MRQNRGFDSNDFASPEGWPSAERALIEAADTAAFELSSVLTGRRSSPPSFPGYHSVQEVHRGGQGVVYCAVQSATGREVAIKVVRGSLIDCPRSRTRFDREVHILGRLRHPNIVTIHDRGEVAHMRFLVMDYIRGQSLDAYLAQHGRPVKHVLELFAIICDAISAAHAHGVIHRDLKPSNIRIDARGEPHVLDFGLAKLTGFHDACAEGCALYAQCREATESGQFLGSLPWASPEQVAGLAEQIDRRTDVYALGVVLCHMLTGHFPYPVSGDLRQMSRSIVEAEPARPSLFQRDVDRDLDTIVLKCLAKRPDERYQDVAALAEDVRRHLNQQPILARPQSTVYQVKKLMARHPWPVTLGVSLLAIVIGFSVWMSVLYGRAAAALIRAVQAEGVAEQHRTDAEREAKTAEAVNDFLIHDMLTSAAPPYGRGQKITIDEVLQNASERIRTAFTEQPLVRASVLSTIAQVYCGLGLHANAEAPLREATAIRAAILGETHRETLAVRGQLVDVLLQTGAYAEGEALAEATHEALRETRGKDDIETLGAAAVLAQAHWFRGRFADALQLRREVLDRRRRVLGEEHPDTLQSLSQWAISEFLDLQSSEQTEELVRQTLERCRRELGEDHPDTLRAMTNLGIGLERQRHFVEAQELLERSVVLSKQVLGTEHPETLTRLVHLAVLREQQERLDEAESLCRTAVEGVRQKLGDDNPIVYWARERLGHIRASQGEYGEALRMHRELLELRRRLPGGDDAIVASALDGVGLMLFKLGRYAESEEAHRQALAIYRRAMGADRAPMWTLRCLVRALGAQGKLEEARPLAEELLDARRKAAEVAERDAYALNAYARELLQVEPADLRNPQVALEFAQKAFDASTDDYDYNRYTLALALRANGRLGEGIEMLRRALAHAPIEGSEVRTEYENALVQFLEEHGEPSAAEQVYRDTLAARRDAAPPDHSDIAASLENLGGVLIRHGKPAEAESVLRERLEIRANVGDEEWRMGGANSLLGLAVARQGRFEEAEPLLMEAFDRLKDSPDVPRDRIRMAAERLVELYESWGKPERTEVYASMAAELTPKRLAE